MNYPNTQTPMTTNFDSYMELNRLPKADSPMYSDTIEIQRRKTKFQETFEYIRRQFGRRKIVDVKH